MSKVFISYSHRDRETARLLAEKMRAAGIHVWFDELDLHPGADIASSIRAGFEASDTIVLLVGKGEYGDSWARREAALALSQKGKRLIPVLLTREVELPFILRHLNALDLTDRSSFNARIETLIRYLLDVGPALPSDESARSDTLAAMKKELDTETSAYSIRAASIQRIAFGQFFAVGIGVLSSVLASLLFLDKVESFDALAKYAYVVLGAVFGIAGTLIFAKISNHFAKRVMDEVETGREQH
jgi:TIR domain